MATQQTLLNKHETHPDAPDAVDLPREQWAVALAAVAAQRSIALAAELSANWRVRPHAVPQVGLSMLCLRESLYGEEFFLGELPLVTAELNIELADGQRYLGAAQLMSDSYDLVVAVAVCDAVLAHRLPGHERVSALVNEGYVLLAARKQQRQAILAATLVNFAELTQADDSQEGTR